MSGCVSIRLIFFLCVCAGVCVSVRVCVYVVLFVCDSAWRLFVGMLTEA